MNLNEQIMQRLCKVEQEIGSLRAAMHDNIDRSLAAAVEAGDEDGADVFAKLRRRYLLEETDNYALTDRAEMSEEMATYRQALRDITNQEGFPLNIVWPVHPDEQNTIA